MHNAVLPLLQVFNRLQKIQVCLSHKSTLRFLDIAAEEYDEKVHIWRESLLPRTADPGNYNYTCAMAVSVLDLFCRTGFTMNSQKKAFMFQMGTKHHLLLKSHSPVSCVWMKVWKPHPTLQSVVNHHQC